ncbi:MAG: GNAT family protein [bacterium]|nr:GNAT family protein [bacterium]
MLRGEKVILRPPERSDVPMFQRWINDREVNRWLITPWPMSLAEEERWYERITSSSTDKILVITTADGTPVGNLGLHRIDHRYRNAELGIAIFEKGYWGQGLGTDAITTFLRFAFDEWNLHRVTLVVREDNHRARRCYDKVGFVVEGVEREAQFSGGRFVNMVRMGILDREFRARHGDSAEP